MRPHDLSLSMGVGSGGQWHSKGGKWGYAPWGAGLRGTTAHFFSFAVILKVFLSRNLD